VKVSNKAPPKVEDVEVPEFLRGIPGVDPAASAPYGTNAY
jgi:hypothetical protein